MISPLSIPYPRRVRSLLATSWLASASLAALLAAPDATNSTGATNATLAAQTTNAAVAPSAQPQSPSPSSPSTNIVTIDFVATNSGSDSPDSSSNSSSRSRRRRSESRSDSASSSKSDSKSNAEHASQPDPFSLDSFKLIADRNIFNPNRSPRRTRDRDRDSDAPPARPPKIESLSLLGIMAYGSKEIAFFDGSESSFRKSVKRSDSIAGLTLKNMDYNSVKLEVDGKSYDLRVGSRLERRGDGPWTVIEGSPLASSATAASTSASSASSSSNSSASDAGGDDILLRLLKKRQEEENK